MPGSCRSVTEERLDIAGAGRGVSGRRNRRALAWLVVGRVAGTVRRHLAPLRLGTEHVLGDEWMAGSGHKLGQQRGLAACNLDDEHVGCAVGCAAVRSVSQPCYVLGSEACTNSRCNGVDEDVDV